LSIINRRNLKKREMVGGLEPAWPQPLRRVLKAVEIKTLFPSLDRWEGAPEVEVHQALFSCVIHGLQQGEGPVEHLFTAERWLRVKNSASQRSWLSILEKYGFPCSVEVDTGCFIDPAIDLVTILGQYADADLEQLLRLSLWLAPSHMMRSGRQEDVALAPADGALTWAPVWLSVDKVEFDKSCHSTVTFKTTTTDSLTRIERDSSQMGKVILLLEAEYLARGIAMEYNCDGVPGTQYLCTAIPTWIGHVEKHEVKRGFCSHQFW
jgi:hypothetical protein